MRYGQRELAEMDPSDASAVTELALGQDILWLDIQGVGSLEVLEAVGRKFALHELVLEDVVNVPQRPKVERYGDQLFVLTRMVRPGRPLTIEQVAIVAGGSWVLTFQEQYDDCLEAVRKRLRDPTSLLRSHGAGFLLYAIVDAIVDGYFPVSEELGDRLELLEAEILEDASQEMLARVTGVKSELMRLRRALWPQREMLSALYRLDSPLLGEDLDVYVRDTLDHCIQLTEINESYRELASGLVNLYMSTLSNRMNEIMKMLTIMASLFIPLTFLAGIYGMNFEHMPELHSRWSYPVVLGAMAVIALGMIRYFFKKGWLGRAH